MKRTFPNIAPSREMVSGWEVFVCMCVCVVCVSGEGSYVNIFFQNETLLI